MSQSWRDTSTSPLRPHSQPESETEFPEEELPESDVQSVNGSYTPPPSTPVTIKPYRFSEDIHKDRHIFLKGASLGIGCGSDSGNSVDGYVPFPDCSAFIPWSGGSLRGRECIVDERGNIFYNGQCVQLGMALGNERLPSLSRVQLGLSSADWSPQRHHERYPHLHRHQQPPTRRRPFNEQLNTYVDTQKRIRSVQCLEDLYRRTPSPVFPYLTIPRRPRPHVRPARVRVQIPHHPPPSLSCNPTSFSTKQSLRSSITNRFFSKAVQAQTNQEGSPSAAPHRNGDKGGNTRDGLGSSDPETALAEARHALRTAQQATNTREYTDYFLAKGGHQGTLGRLFESYPKRVLMVQPGRLLRQRSEMVSRSRTRLLQ